MTTTLSVHISAAEPASVQLPATITDGHEGLHWLADHRDEVEEALLEHGALYLANAHVVTNEHFAAARDLLFREPAAYREKATPRTDLGDGVFSSTDLPAGQSIRQHNENSYTLTFPGKLLFGCLQAPEAGGATTVADVRAVLDDVDPRVREAMRSTGWMLTRTYQDLVGLPWQVAFNTDDRSVVERYCADNDIECSWQGDTLRTRQVRPGVIEHPVTGRRAWFNHAAFWSRWSLPEEVHDVLVAEFGSDGLPFSTAFGDGSGLDREAVEQLNTAYDRHTRRRSWVRGDLLLVDNLASSHGRDPYTGDRRIVVAMGDPVALSDCADSHEARP